MDPSYPRESRRSRGNHPRPWHPPERLAVFKAYDLPREFSIAVRAHLGWNHREGAGSARYYLTVSFEALDMELPVYERIEAENRIEIETETEIQIPL